MSTIHADSPEGALDQLALLVLQGGSRLRIDDVLAYAKRTIDIGIQLSKRSFRRGISHVTWNDSHNSENHKNK
jgi:type IV secretion system protein VirB11